MRILVLSDSHGSLRFMRRAAEALSPDAIVHLGDCFEDGEVVAQENSRLCVHQVPGNCDRYRLQTPKPEWLCYSIGGVMLYMTHGHLHRVKMGLGGLLADARKMRAGAVLYGHTHIPDAHREPDGLWVLNPGACGSAGGSVGLLETNNGEITDCRVIPITELEEKL